MTSRLISFARILQSKTAVATRSAPAALAESLKKTFGSAAASTNPDDQEVEAEEEANSNGDTTTDDQNSRGNNEPTQPELARATDEGTNQGPGLFSALLGTRGPPGRVAASGPIASPWAREELRESIRGYYHRAVAESREREANAANRQIIEDPDLSVPVGDRYLYVAQ
uniref:Uncharacterized protein n=1 Tax=Pseudo-nitzschia australis TaxID=44445 RepID=A0A7S4AE43_9STRA|mmetsp:Transcript_7014/g.15863  ORF Transcript_7014/g.15863 Transcript_7014/m.15863 type:complete len:169 (-) Transcript_7014:1025-1531(-)|eukprot:CAMPEP_0168200592 /NCGR_PEP_ID=MMETSP0139_2-20121125/23183_1 /TAXON_ID=44445 /ORGANISM="Pseudo-nitzschia australis, Strain 10249 10 AB" /LENGTH=168 /DNA_ID=CAMNT_0008125947 /DNA_START=208 /DNA_END=714 /DNA_ORIENTATION=+